MGPRAYEHTNIPAYKVVELLSTMCIDRPYDVMSGFEITVLSMKIQNNYVSDYYYSIFFITLFLNHQMIQFKHKCTLRREVH